MLISLWICLFKSNWVSDNGFFTETYKCSKGSIWLVSFHYICFKGILFRIVVIDRQQKNTMSYKRVGPNMPHFFGVFNPDVHTRMFLLS